MMSVSEPNTKPASVFFVHLGFLQMNMLADFFLKISAKSSL
jgi:hypothetical protein